MLLYVLIVMAVFQIATAVYLGVYIRRVKELQDELDRVQIQLANCAANVAGFQAEFTQYMENEALQIGEALRESQKREEAFYDGFSSIVNYSVAEAYKANKENDE